MTFTELAGALGCSVGPGESVLSGIGWQRENVALVKAVRPTREVARFVDRYLPTQPAQLKPVHGM